MNRTHARALRYRRAVLTAIDFTRAQSTQQLADRLGVTYGALYHLLVRMEREELVIAVPGRPVAWRRPHAEPAA